MAMKWIPLDGKKDPEFDTFYALLFYGGGWMRGCLTEKKTSSKVTEYIWTIDGERWVGETITHYMKIDSKPIEPPKNNQ